MRARRGPNEYFCFCEEGTSKVDEFLPQIWIVFGINDAQGYSESAILHAAPAISAAGRLAPK